MTGMIFQRRYLSLWFKFNDNAREAQTAAAADCRLAECKMEVFTISNRYWFTWYPLLFAPTLHKSVSEQEKTRVSWTRWETRFGKTASYLKIQRWILRPVTSRMPFHSEIAERINSEVSVLKRQLYSRPWTSQTYLLCAAWLCESCHLTDMAEPSPAPQEALTGAGLPGGGGGGEQIKRAGITSDWGAKEKETRGWRICQGAEERQPNSSFPTSAWSNLLTSGRRWKTDREGEEEMKGRGRKLQSRGCRHQRADWCRATRWGWADCNIDSGMSVLPRAASCSETLLPFHPRRSSVRLLFISQNNIFKKCVFRHWNFSFIIVENHLKKCLQLTDGER